MVQLPYLLDLLHNQLASRSGQHRDAIPGALAMTNDDLATLSVDILDPQLAALLQSQPGAIQQKRHQARLTLHQRQDAMHIPAGKHVRQPMRPFRRHRADGGGYRLAKDITVQELQRGQRLILG